MVELGGRVRESVGFHDSGGRQGSRQTLTEQQSHPRQALAVFQTLAVKIIEPQEVGRAWNREQAVKHLSCAVKVTAREPSAIRYEA
jgi:hypothetical protein